MTKEQLLQRALEAKELPTLPAVAGKVLSLTAAEEPDMKAITRVIAEDVSLTAKVLRVINSPIYGIPRTVGSIRQAITLLGSNTIRGIVLTFTLVGLRPRHDFDYDRFWEKSLMTAILSRRIVRDLPQVNKEDAFIAGLLANIGEMLLALTLADDYRDMLLFAREHAISTEEAERLVIGIHHAEFGAAVARHWCFPDGLCEVIAGHGRHGAAAGTEPKPLVHAVYLADAYTRMLHGEPLPQGEQATVADSQQRLELDADFLSHVAPVVQDEMKLAAEFFGLRVASGLSLEEILQEANRRLGQMHLDNERRKSVLLRAQAELLQANQGLEDKSRELQDLANNDGLTQTYNHRYFQEFLKTELSRAARSGQCTSLIMMDIDNFKGLNDTHGHLAGDAVLREFCRVVHRTLREYDLMARYGGEEFAIILPDTDNEEAAGTAERIRLLVENHIFAFNDLRLGITISLGVATLCPQPDRTDPSNQLIDLADHALLEAKRAGKNRVHTIIS